MRAQIDADGMRHALEAAVRCWQRVPVVWDERMHKKQLMPSDSFRKAERGGNLELYFRTVDGNE